MYHVKIVYQSGATLDFLVPGGSTQGDLLTRAWALGGFIRKATARRVRP